MNDTILAGPCAGYEFDIVELHEGALGPAEATRVRQHVEGCVRCREWQARYATLDAALARELPRPQLSADFHSALCERIKGVADPATRRNMRAAIEREHDWMVRDLRRSARRRALLGAAAGASVAAAGIALAILFRPQAATLMQSLDAYQGPSAMGILGTVAVMGALAWSATRGVLPGVPLRR